MSPKATSAKRNSYLCPTRLRSGLAVSQPCRSSAKGKSPTGRSSTPGHSRLRSSTGPAWTPPRNASSRTSQIRVLRLFRYVLDRNRAFMSRFCRGSDARHSQWKVSFQRLCPSCKQATTGLFPSPRPRLVPCWPAFSSFKPQFSTISATPVPQSLAKS